MLLIKSRHDSGLGWVQVCIVSDSKVQPIGPLLAGIPIKKTNHSNNKIDSYQKTFIRIRESAKAHGPRETHNKLGEKTATTFGSRKGPHTRT